MIYLDNSATGGFKPNAVYSAVENAVKYLSANPGRSGHRLSVTGANIVYDTRKLIANCFNSLPEKVIFTKNCTEALNLAIFGLYRQGGHVITTIYEHNSVLRPLYHLQKQGLITLDVIDAEADDLPQRILSCIKSNTCMVVTNSVSNVTGEILPVKQIGEVCKKYDIYYVVDGAQGGGHISLDIKSLNISALALAGHKGLYGIMGSGVLVLNDIIDPRPLIFGGTGTESFLTTQPEYYPEKLESGTLNLPAICSLFEGVRYAFDNLKFFSSLLYDASKEIIDKLCKIDGVKMYSFPNPAGIISFSLFNTDSTLIADILNNDYDIAVRGGLHCAPLIHKKLGTDKNGLIRVSLCPQNSFNERQSLIKAISEISKKITAEKNL